jgi:BirA family transcriptional regulator, biotin operon repressor / biotin---[acetyl-CoA-carboxylase] ligase
VRWREQVVAETGSTNTDVVARALAGEPEGFVLVARRQTAARGRRGRSWQAPAGSGLMFSALLRPAEVAAARWSLLPLLVGAAVARGLAVAGGVGVRLKWPNDLLVDEGKLGGILLERVETSTGPAAIAGVGINVVLAPADLPVPGATSLSIAGATCTDHAVLLDAVLAQLAAGYLRWRAAGGSGDAVLPDYAPLCATLGRQVRVQLPGGDSVDGLAADIAPDGALVVETRTGRRAVGAGDVVRVR